MVSQPEKFPWLVFLPIVATLIFYTLPSSYQKQTIVQFLPQILAYCGLGVWATFNSHLRQRLGFTPHNLFSGVAWGTVVGFILGTLNTILILWGIPAAGWDIAFLKETPPCPSPYLDDGPLVHSFHRRGCGDQFPRVSVRKMPGPAERSTETLA